ncbi:MAG: SusD/RagB family nutrient-binding outer membrane lipoprotein [Capnocytophaga sp.]|nr:SusD/RagB family nutrient-binding outer membrane lipoprotein [Capnocytophaga sp.]
MKKFIIPIIALLAGASCTKDFAEMNKSTYGITDKELERIPVGGQDLLSLQKLVVPQQENSYQMCFDLPATPLSGYGAQIQRFQEDYAGYNPRTAWVDYIFDDTYPKIYLPYFNLKRNAKDDISKPFFAWGTILRVAITHWITDSYGPLPYSQMEQGKQQVPYDKQSDLYIQLCEDLKSSIEVIKTISADDRQYRDYDIVYEGDMTKWTKYANSLLLRIAIRMSDVNEEKAKEYAQYAISNGVITSNADNAKLKTNDNPAFKVSTTWVNSCAGADFVEYMNAFSDPRREKMLTSVTSRSGNTFFGLRSGVSDKSISQPAFSNYSMPNLKTDSDIYWITAAEVAFLKAEAALKGWSFISETAEDLYKQGVTLSFEQWGASGADQYLTNTNTRGNFTDEKQTAYNTTFSSPISVSWADAGNDKEKQLARIITQKWIAMFPYGAQEAWAEWRRTGYPNLMPIIDNKSGGIVANITRENGKDKGAMRRLPFSSKETTQNPTYKNIAIGYLNGADNGATDLWWVKK